MWRCKRLVFLIITGIFLVGCTSPGNDVDIAMQLRKKILESDGCTFRAHITADYEDALYSFVMDCRSEADGSLSFTVIEPQSISGITGAVSAQDGKLTFDDQILLFETIADGQLTPVSAPWVFLTSLRSGYITSCGKDGEGHRIRLNDSYAGNALQLEVWLNNEGLPVDAEILWGGRRFLSLNIEDFLIV